MVCTADLLLTFVWDETASGTARSKTSMLLLTVPEAVSSHTKARSRSAVQSINFEQDLSLAPRCPRGSLVPYKSEENQFHPVLALPGPGAPMRGPTASSFRTNHGIWIWKVFTTGNNLSGT